MKHRLMSLVIILGISFSITSCSNSKKSIIRNTSSTTPITDFFSKTSIPATEEAKPEETKPEETKPEETKPEETKPEETKPEETKPEETKPEETKPEETKPEETKPDETKPEETKPEETRPEETKPEETKPEETKPEETKPEETKPEETKPEETKPKETKPEETKPKETKPEETKPKETKPEETKPEETKPENEDECKAKNRISAKRLKRYPKTFEEYDFRKVIFDNVYLDSGTKLSHMIIEGFYDIAFIKFWVHPPNNGSTFNIFVGSDGELYYGGFSDDCLLISEKELFEDIPEIGLEYIERYMN